MKEDVIITDAIQYILIHLYETITVDDVARHCHLSKFYFSRYFKAKTGLSVYAFIRKTKLEQSALKLKIEKDRSITDIGMDYGYSASNYSSAFHQYHKKSPVTFRKELSTEPLNIKEIYDQINQKIKIMTLPDYHVMYERYIGNYSDMKNMWPCFIEKYREHISNDTIFFDRTFDDPSITDQDSCIYDICMSINDYNAYSNTCIIEGGKYAVYPYKGQLKDMPPISEYLRDIWFPLSHYAIDERYSYEKYNIISDDGYLDFDICIPIK